ncbi:hypothetical protein [Qipengyuania sp. MTN3-11]|uniref:hypothetical protein n=1 Tax=Qipengyuania sp. MTN3-11 TaxID=3056557 RepID=UPI0036F2C801
MNAPADLPTPNLPALLEQLPEGDSRKPQLEFTLAVKREFLEALSVVGSVRSAAKRARVSHQTVYRARRACAAFRRCWDAALLQALPRAEDVLASRAIDGVEETVYYHGEEVARRRRYDPRLLLAHIARLDKLAARADVAALSDCFDEALEALERGEPLPEPSPEAAPAKSSPGPCHTRSMSNTPAAPAGDWPDPLDEGTGDPLRDAMEEARPWGEKLPADYPDSDLVESVQMAAFDGGVEQWWRVTGEAELDAALDALEAASGVPGGA